MAGEAEALADFLQTQRADWPKVAPELVDRVGMRDLQRVVDETVDRLGRIESVDDGPQGLVLRGPVRSVLAWAQVGTDGSLTGLLISPEPPAPRRRSARAVRVRSRLARTLAFTFLALDVWTADHVGDWVGYLLIFTTLLVFLEGFGSPAQESWWFRRGLEALFVAGVVSAVRIPGMRPGGGIGWIAVGGLVLALVVTTLVRARRRRWGEATAPLPVFPLPGRWYVLQGGGSGLNHHTGVRAQRGAVDLVRVGPHGTRRSAAGSVPADFLAYGEPVVAPCDGVVVRVVDGLPDQVPGAPRYGPVFGNHVGLARGRDLMILAHLAPGSITVPAGTQVRAGDPLGRVGNSGNTTEPHLHLHVERDGAGLDLVFAGLPHLYRGRTVGGRG